MPVNWTAKDELRKKYEAQANDAVNIVGAQMVTWAVEECPVDTGNLTNSISYSTDTTRSEVRGKTDGTAIAQPTMKHTARVGSNVEYAAAVEFGYTGEDKNGRTHNRPAKPFLRPAVENHKSEINKILVEAMRG